MSKSTLRKGFLAFLIVALVGGMSAMPAMASNTAINYDASAAPQPEMTGDVTIADHPMGDGPLTYNDNNGDWVALAGHVNESVDNPYEFYASDVNFSDAGAFPHAKDGVSALTASEWSSTWTNLTASDVETASGVDAVNIATDGTFGTGDSATATFGNFSITSDEEKRYLQLVGDINTLDSGATVDVRVIDEDGDYYNATINPGASDISDSVIANQTGDGFVYQQQLGTLTMTQVGDGTFNNIQKVEVVVSDADADVSFSAINVDKMGAWDFGDKLVDNDSDDALETVQIIDHNTGSIALSDLGTMGNTFANAHIKDLTVPFVQPASALPSDDVGVEFTPAEQYSNYESHFKGDLRFELPDAYDLSYANLVLRDTVSLPGTRYVSVEYAEGTGDTAFADISSYSAITSNYDSAGANVTVDNTIQPGTAMVLSYDYVVTSSEKTNLQNTGAVMGPTGESGGLFGGFFGTLFGKLTAFIGGLGIIQGIRGGWPFSG